MARIISSDYLSLDFDIQTKKKLDKLYAYVDGLKKMETDPDFQAEIKKHCMDTLTQVMNDNLTGGTTNDEFIELYMGSNYIEDLNTSNGFKGFIMYNNAKIPADTYSAYPFDTSGYPEGQFSIALAFEYGVGVLGEATNVVGSNYTYNDLNHSKSESHKMYGNQWYLPYFVNFTSGELTSGYAGFQIYTLTAREITKKLPEWVNEYMEKKV